MAALLTDLELLGRLVAFDSVSRNSNLPIADFICDYLDHPLCDVARNFNEDQSKVNLVIRVRADTKPTSPDIRSAQMNGGGLVLSGHMDVVPAEESDWRSDPFVLTETGDSLVARGACDMKGFVALAMNTMRLAVEWGLREPLVLILTFDEELGTLGAQHFQKTWNGEFALPKQAVIGEPTSLRVVRMHKGHTKMKAVFLGRGAHSGYPHLGVNAIEPGGRAIVALGELRRRLEGERADTSVHFPEVPFVALNVARVNGGSAMNIVPESCTVEWGFRPLPGMSSGPLIQRMERAVREAVNGAACEIVVTGDTPPFLTSSDSELHRKMCGFVEQDQSFGVSYASDAGPLAQMGMECVLFGPGTIETAHKPNESLPKAEFVRARAVLERAVQEFCRAEAS